MKVEVICQNNDINKILNIDPIGYETALRKTLYKIKENHIISSWKDAWGSGQIDQKLIYFMNVPTYGCFVDKRKTVIENHQKSIDKIWRIGGQNGWYYATWMWQLRGFIDKLFGGVGLRRGRTHPYNLSAGDAIDFWRVLYADKKEGRLLLFAEMKLPGEAWLEFNIVDNVLCQTATFRPKGLLGRLYWYLVLPFHGIIFKGMINKLN